MSSPPPAEALLRQLSRISKEQRWPVEWTPRFVGNALSEQQRIRIVDIASAILRSRAPFAQSIGSRLELSEVKVSRREEDHKVHLRFTFEVDTTPDMLNAFGSMHGSCTTFLIDASSSIALTALSAVAHKLGLLVSQSLTTSFHSPAPPGARLRIIAETVAFSSRTASAEVQIWDVTNGRLIATGMHNQMQMSKL
ncbi:hypothetical protein PYCCODRAFT_1465192 [Trametes coccinea BRFM310]|uniref:Thioesterase domain-containing protein n=1 Tax=Trametes coccinea (strain BRFM310) TaxID=1353009 RepID=A0A1Y2IVT1_TRAC3|nr:hypothetical protein PYCCODRAFT_1465192 [Trametes coccinea BRFM310]